MNIMSNEIYKGIGQSFQGFYKTAIVNGLTEEVVWESDWCKNLILNQGMDAIYSTNLADLTLYACAGVGTRPNSISGESSEITQSGTNVYLNLRTGMTDFTASNAGYSSNVEVGDVLKYANASESMVSSVSPLNLVVNTNYTFTSGQTFVVWKTSQVGLQSEVSRSAAYVSGTGFCETTTVGNARTWRRTYNFPVQASSVSYNELGVAWAASLNTTVFSRILLGSPLVIGVGFYLRVIYDLVGTFTPATEIYTTASIGGWPVAPSTNTIGSESLQVFLTSTVGSNGATTATSAVLDPAWIANGNYSLAAFASPISTNLAVFGSAVNRSNAAAGYGGAASKASYTAGSYYVDKTSVIPITLANGAHRTIGMGRLYAGGGVYPYAAAETGIAFLFNQTQSKQSTETLSLTYRTTWGRTLA